MTSPDSSTDVRVDQHEDRVTHIVGLLEIIMATDLTRPATVQAANAAFEKLCAELGEDAALELLASLPRLPRLDSAAAPVVTVVCATKF